MKQNQRLLLGMVLFLFALSGCSSGGGSSSGGSGISASDLLGTWRSTGIRSPSGSFTTCPGSVDITATSQLVCSALDLTTFLSNGTVFLFGQPEVGNWSLSGTALTLSQHGITLVVNNVSLSGSTLTWTLSSASDPGLSSAVGSIFTLVKQ